ncbi:tRNA 2-thiouridine(34) synthase MnmA [Arenicella xantha]|uniref:tRNA-specific 2-thiouridylase MnmA n=1 Tax=Arenicella xantha TaxID=644221 RepID=A0A395JS96_9GAMM|nr:tRNA 2-thiouridine(34) synthase MnmA [Arenicella xantha]RBP51560.1 tRNA (5-methylaminomethyl-2-thiouridylate)-methyltransferase [Arenicella xantha]
MNQDKPTPSETHVVVGMSGGVDSSVTAYLLKQKGYRVTGMFMKNWEEDDTEEYCAAATDLKDAAQVCDRLDIELREVNFAHEYWENVFEHFLAEYQAGRTPNPDILCNKEIKFKEFLLQAETIGAQYIATGHYVAKGQDGDQALLLRGSDENKDQSYFLYTLQQFQLTKSLFPLGEITKPEVRKIADEQGFVTHDKKDSTGICFIGERRFKDFLSTYLKPNPGAMVNTDGETVGQHDGLMYYTLGQRHGLDIGGPGAAWYVAGKDLAENKLLVVQGHDHPAMLSQSVVATGLDWVSATPLKVGDQVTAKTRYRQQDQACQVTAVGDDSITVRFDQPQRAVTPGQALVFYDGRRCLGGGTIESYK